jgi:hypothetical protein
MTWFFLWFSIHLCNKIVRKNSFAFNVVEIKSQWIIHTFVHISRELGSEVCNAVLKSCSLKEHMKTVHGEKIYQCEHCLKHYTTPVKLNWHFKTVHGPKLLACEVCGKKCSTLGKMNAHKKTHLEVKNFIDLHCFLYLAGS